MRRHWVVGAAVGGVLPVLFGAGYLVSRGGVDAGPATERDVGAGIQVTGMQVPHGLKATPLPGATIPIASAVSLGPVVAITPDGPLDAPMTMQFPLVPTVREGATVFVAVQDASGRPWEYQEATVGSGGAYATITRNHLSRFWPFQLKLDVWFRESVRQLTGAFTSEVTTEAERPSCAGRDEAERDGYAFSSTGTAALYWCSGVEQGKRTIKITNRMRYPLNVDHPGFDVVSAGTVQAEFGHLARLGSGQRTILFPYDTAVLTTELDTGAKATISTDYSGRAQHLHRVDVAVAALVAMAGKVGKGEIGGTARDAWRALDKMLEKRDCLDAVRNSDLGAAVVHCFDSATLKRIFDWRGLLLAPATASGSLFDWMRGEIDSLGDQLDNRARSRVTVSRAHSSKRFVGDWRVHGTSVSFKAGGTGTISRDEGPCNGAHLCTATMDLTWRMAGTRLIYKVTSFAVADDTGQPPSDLGRDGEIVGVEYTVEYVRKGLLKIAAATNREFAPSNPYLCGAGTDSAECGA